MATICFESETGNYESFTFKVEAFKGQLKFEGSTRYSWLVIDEFIKKTETNACKSSKFTATDHCLVVFLASTCVRSGQLLHFRPDPAEFHPPDIKYDPEKEQLTIEAFAGETYFSVTKFTVPLKKEVMLEALGLLLKRLLPSHEDKD